MRDYARAITVDDVTTLIAQALAIAPRGTAARLARQLDVTPQTVSKWVAGEVMPDQSRWPAIEQALGLTDGALLSAHRAAVVTPLDDDRDMPRAVMERLTELGAELQQLRAELAELRSEVHAPRRSSDPAPPAPSSTRHRARTP